VALWYEEEGRRACFVSALIDNPLIYPAPLLKLSRQVGVTWLCLSQDLCLFSLLTTICRHSLLLSVSC